MRNAIVLNMICEQYKLDKRDVDFECLGSKGDTYDFIAKTYSTDGVTEYKVSVISAKTFIKHGESK